LTHVICNAIAVYSNNIDDVVRAVLPESLSFFYNTAVLLIGWVGSEK